MKMITGGEKGIKTGNVSGKEKRKEKSGLQIAEQHPFHELIIK